MPTIESNTVQALTLITPIRQGFVLIEKPRIEVRYVDRLRGVLEEVKKIPREENGIEKIEVIHFARWVVIDDGQRLLFTSNYVGRLDQYLTEFSIKLAPWLDAVWSNCEDYPGATDFDAFRRWVYDHQIPEAYSYAANPDVTVKDVRWLQSFYSSYQQLVRDAEAHPERLPELFAALQSKAAGAELSSRAQRAPVSVRSRAHRPHALPPSVPRRQDHGARLADS